MIPTLCRLGTMDAPPRPSEVITLPARHLKGGERIWRAAKRLFGVSGLLLLVGNLALLFFPVPHVHLCLFPIAFVLGPVLAWFAGKERVVFAGSDFPCPRCHDTAHLPEGLSGWPARFNCLHCGIMVELNPVTAARTAP